MKLDTMHHIAIIGSDYEKSKKFYVDILGFEVIRENCREDRKDYKIDLRQGNIEIELFIIPRCPKRLSYPEANGLRHLAFKVESVEEMAKELEKLGVEVEPIRIDEFTGEQMTFFFDPDGLPLELHG